MELFKDIAGYEGLYQVGTEGTIKSLNYNHTGKEKELVKNKLNTGYYVVTLHKDGKRKNHLVHRIVAEANKKQPIIINGLIKNSSRYTKINGYILNNIAIGGYI